MNFNRFTALPREGHLALSLYPITEPNTGRITVTDRPSDLGVVRSSPIYSTLAQPSYCIYSSVVWSPTIPINVRLPTHCCRETGVWIGGSLSPITRYSIPLLFRSGKSLLYSSVLDLDRSWGAGRVYLFGKSQGPQPAGGIRAGVRAVATNALVIGLRIFCGLCENLSRDLFAIQFRSRTCRSLGCGKRDETEWIKY